MRSLGGTPLAALYRHVPSLVIRPPHTPRNICKEKIKLTVTVVVTQVYMNTGQACDAQEAKRAAARRPAWRGYRAEVHRGGRWRAGDEQAYRGNENECTGGGGPGQECGGPLGGKNGALAGQNGGAGAGGAAAPRRTAGSEATSAGVACGEKGSFLLGVYGYLFSWEVQREEEGTEKQSAVVGRLLFSNEAGEGYAGAAARGRRWAQARLPKLVCKGAGVGRGEGRMGWTKGGGKGKTGVRVRFENQRWGFSGELVQGGCRGYGFVMEAAKCVLRVGFGRRGCGPGRFDAWREGTLRDAGGRGGTQAAASRRSRAVDGRAGGAAARPAQHPAVAEAVLVHVAELVAGLRGRRLLQL